MHQKLSEIIVKGALPLSVADMAAKGATFIIALLIARFLGPSVYGQYAIAASVCGIVMLMAGIGFEQEFLRQGGLDRNRIGHYLRINLWSLVLTLVVSYIALAIFSHLSRYDTGTIFIILLFGVGFSLNRMQLPFRYYCLLHQKNKLTAAVQISAIILNAAVTMAIIMTSGKLAHVIVGQIAIIALTLIFWLMWCPDYTLKAGEISYQKLLHFVKRSLPFAISNIVWMLYFNLDTFILSIFRSEAHVGIYSGIYRIIGINYILGYALTNTFTPHLYECYKKNKEAFIVLSKKLCLIKFSAGAITAVVLLVGASPIIVILIGSRYLSGLPIAHILCAAVLFRFLNFGLGEILTTSANQKKRVGLEIQMLLLNGVMNFLLIPYYGGIGAALATLASEIYLTFATGWFCYKLILNK